MNEIKYQFGELIDEMPERVSNSLVSTYADIWKKIDEIPPDKILPIIWETWSDAYKFSQACKSKRIGKVGRPNMYSDFKYRQVDNIVYVQGHQNEITN